MIPTFSQLRSLLRWFLYLLGAACFVIAALMLYVYSQFGGTGELPVECAMVFGAAVHSASDPGPGIFRRVETAANLYKEGNVKKIFLTGGKGSETQDSEAHVMRKVALLQGVDSDDVVTEDQSRSTWENILNTRPLAQDCASIVGISDRYHLARIAYLAKLQGWGDIRTLPAQRTAPWYFELKSVAREAFGIMYYFALQFA